MTKEDVYDLQINPLMAKIVNICLQHKIAVIATFALDSTDLICTTALLTPDHEPFDCQLEASKVLTRGMKKSRQAMMITERNAQGEVDSMTAIL